MNDLLYVGLPSCNHQSIVVFFVMITLVAGASKLPQELVRHPDNFALLRV
jgi:hypothetical protein